MRDNARKYLTKDPGRVYYHGICSVNAGTCAQDQPGSRALLSKMQFLKRRKLKDDTCGISALSLMRRGFPFLTATGKNINTGGWAAASQQGPGRRAQARRRVRPGSQSQLAHIQPVGGARGRLEGTRGPRLRHQAAGSIAGKICKRGHKLSCAWGQRRLEPRKLRGPCGSECEIQGT